MEKELDVHRVGWMHIKCGQLGVNSEASDQ